MTGYDNERALDLMIKQASAKTAEEANKFENEIHELYNETVEEDEETPEVVYEPSYGDTIPYPEEVSDEEDDQGEEASEDDDVVYEPEDMLEAMARSLTNPNKKAEETKVETPVAEETVEATNEVCDEPEVEEDVNEVDIDPVDKMIKEVTGNESTDESAETAETTEESATDEHGVVYNGEDL